MSDGRQAVDSEPAYILHQRPYRNTSQLIECLSLNYGRVGLIAQGSRRPRAGMRSILQPFIPLRLSWVRRGELGRLTNAESAGDAIDLTGARLMAAYYVNELLMNLTARDDPNSEVFSHYSRFASRLLQGSGLARSLRLFELGLLESLGFGLQLLRDESTHRPIQPESNYSFDPDAGPRLTDAIDSIRGEHLISLREERLDDIDSLRAAGQVLWQALSGHLGSKRIRSREVLRDMVDRGLLR